VASLLLRTKVKLKVQLLTRVALKVKTVAKKLVLQMHLVQVLNHPQKNFFKGKEAKINHLLV
jgi:hypothetical protein